MVHPYHRISSAKRGTSGGIQIYFPRRGSINFTYEGNKAGPLGRWALMSTVFSPFLRESLHVPCSKVG